MQHWQPDRDSPVSELKLANQEELFVRHKMLKNHSQRALIGIESTENA